MTTEILSAALVAATLATAPLRDDRTIVADLETAYQAAVKQNDAAAMDKILHEQFTLVLGDGRTVSRADLLDEARSKRLTWEQQDEEAGTQTVRVWGDTAVVTDADHANRR